MQTAPLNAWSSLFCNVNIGEYLHSKKDYLFLVNSIYQHSLQLCYRNKIN